MTTENKLNDVLAENLRRLKEEGAFKSALDLSRKVAHSGGSLSDSVIGYMMQTKKRDQTHKGKSASCKLESVEAIARALGIHPIELLTSHSESKGALLAAFERVPKERQEYAVSVVDALALKKSHDNGGGNKISKKTEAKKEDKYKTGQPLASNGH